MATLVKGCTAVLLIAFAEVGFAQNDLSEAERNFINNIAQARASVARCGRLAIDEKKTTLAAVEAKVDMGTRSARSFYAQRSSALKALFEGYNREAACAAALQFYGAKGKNVPGLVK
jgi:hypothetical protein